MFRQDQLNITRLLLSDPITLEGRSKHAHFLEILEKSRKILWKYCTQIEIMKMPKFSEMTCIFYCRSISFYFM